MTSIGMRAFGVAVALVFVASACTTTRFQTSANFDTEYDFAKVETFAFHGQREKIAQSGNGQILEMTLREELIARDYREVPVDQADVYVHYDYGRYAPAKLSGSNSLAINRGTLTVSVLDPGTMRTVWYGWVETNMRKGDDGEVVIAEAVQALFDGQLPDGRAPKQKHPVAEQAGKVEKKADEAVDDAMDEVLDGGKGK
jgi:hypothetical protein